MRRPTRRAIFEPLEIRTLLCGGSDPLTALADFSTARSRADCPALIASFDLRSSQGASGEATVSPQYTVKHPPRLQIGNAKLHGFPGSDRDQVELLWQTIPAGSGTEDSFTVEYRPVGQTAWTSGGPIGTIATGVEGRIIHSSEISGLAFDSSYEYRVQHLRAGSPIQAYQAEFRTRLPVDSNQSFMFAAYGDSANPSSLPNFRSVQSRINQVNPSFAVLLGDNIYTSSSHTESDVRFDPSRSPEAVSWIASHIDYPAIGNHEINGGSLGKPYEEMFSVPIPIQGQTSTVQPPTSERPEHNYSFDYGNVHFLTFDTNSEGSSTRLNNLLTWAEQDLQASNAKWKIVFGHHPVAGTPDKTENPGDNYYKQVVPRLRAAGVDLFLVGHSHTYARTYPLLGQNNGTATFVLDTDHDYAKGAGLIQLISGVGGSSVRGGSFSQFPYVARGFTSETNPPGEFGFTLIDVTPTQLTVRYISAATGNVLDSFTITQPQAPPNNSPPVANPQSLVTNEDTSKSIVLTGSDADGDPLTYLVMSNPTNGTLSGTAPNLNYKPNANFNGTDSFRFKVNDGYVDSSVATVSITVNAVNDAPVADPVAATTASETPVSITLTGSDVEGDPLTFSIKSNPASGTLSGTAPNLTYTPVSGFTGTDTFTYGISDGKSNSNVATVTVTVTGSTSSTSISFQNGVFPTTSYKGTIDTKIRGDLPTQVLHTSKTLELDGNPDMATLLKWDIRQIPVGSTVTAASITLNVINTSNHVFQVYKLVQAWNASATTFHQYDSGKTWEVNGAQGPKDRNPTVLATVTAPALGKLRIDLNSAGVAAVQDWINDPANNHGLIIQNYDNAATNDLDFTASEGSTQLRPRLSISYTAGAVTTSASTLRTARLRTNPSNPYDVNADRIVSPNDALVVINTLNRSSSLGQGEGDPTGDEHFLFLDVSGDSAVTPIDALMIVNYLNYQGGQGGLGGQNPPEGEALSFTSADAISSGGDINSRLALDLVLAQMATWGLPSSTRVTGNAETDEERKPVASAQLSLQPKAASSLPRPERIFDDSTSWMHPADDPWLHDPHVAGDLVSLLLDDVLDAIESVAASGKPSESRDA